MVFRPPRLEKNGYGREVCMQAAERAGRQETRTDDRDAQLARVRAAFARVNNVRVCHVHAPAEDPTRRVASRVSDLGQRLHRSRLFRALLAGWAKR